LKAGAINCRFLKQQTIRTCTRVAYDTTACLTSVNSSAFCNASTCLNLYLSVYPRSPYHYTRHTHTNTHIHTHTPQTHTPHTHTHATHTHTLATHTSVRNASFVDSSAFLSACSCSARVSLSASWERSLRASSSSSTIFSDTCTTKMRQAQDLSKSSSTCRRCAFVLFCV